MFIKQWGTPKSLAQHINVYLYTYTFKFKRHKKNIYVYCSYQLLDKDNDFGTFNYLRFKLNIYKSWSEDTFSTQILTHFQDV